jgi:hypothetical protein
MRKVCLTDPFVPCSALQHPPPPPTPHTNAVQEERIGVIQSRFEEKIARSEQLRLAHLAAVSHRAGDETRKVCAALLRVQTGSGRLACVPA